MTKSKKKAQALNGKQARYLRGLGHHLKPLAMLGKEAVKAAIAVTVEQAFGFNVPLIPAADHLGLTQLSHLQVVGMDIHIADDFHIGDRLNQLVGHFKQRASKVTRNTLIAATLALFSGTRL